MFLLPPRKDLSINQLNFVKLPRQISKSFCYFLFWRIILLSVEEIWFGISNTSKAMPRKTVPLPQIAFTLTNIIVMSINCFRELSWKKNFMQDNVNFIPEVLRAREGCGDSVFAIKRERLQGCHDIYPQ